jgi:DNA-binding Lrp family transcriptional regulator
VKWLPSNRHQASSCERRKSRAAARSQAGAALPWTSERADMLFVCERGRQRLTSASLTASGASNVWRNEQRRSFLCERRRRRRIPRAMREQLKIKVTAMVTAIVFVKAEVARIPEVAEAIAELNGVSEVYSVTGTIDLIVMIRVSNHDQVADIVADRLNKVPGVVSTETHIAFRAYSAHDLEAAFSLGG